MIGFILLVLIARARCVCLCVILTAPCSGGGDKEAQVHSLPVQQREAEGAAEEGSVRGR